MICFPRETKNWCTFAIWYRTDKFLNGSCFKTSLDPCVITLSRVLCLIIIGKEHAICVQCQVKAIQELLFTIHDLVYHGSCFQTVFRFREYLVILISLSTFTSFSPSMSFFPFSSFFSLIPPPQTHHLFLSNTSEYHPTWLLSLSLLEILPLSYEIRLHNLQWFYLLLAAAKSLQSCPTLCDPIDRSPPGSPTPGILQARTLEWVAISFSNAWK